MNNSEAAELFLELADLLDLAGELPFKASSYRKVAVSLQNLDEPFEIVVKENRFDKIPGAGKAIKEKLKAIAETGRLPSLEKWREHEVYQFYPWLEVYNVKPRQLGMLARKLEAVDIKDLQRKLKGYDLQKLVGKSKQTARTLLDKS